MTLAGISASDMPGREDKFHPVQIELLKQKTMAERLELACQLSCSVLEIKRQKLREELGDVGELALLRRLCSDLYGEDLAELAYGKP